MSAVSFRVCGLFVPSSYCLFESVQMLTTDDTEARETEATEAREADETDALETEATEA